MRFFKVIFDLLLDHSFMNGSKQYALKKSAGVRQGKHLGGSLNGIFVNMPKIET